MDKFLEFGENGKEREREREVGEEEKREEIQGAGERVSEWVRASYMKKGNHLTNEVVCNICEKVDDGW